MQGKELRAAFAANVREWRLFRNMTQVELAKAAMIAQAHVSNIEEGKRFPNPDIIAALAEALGTTPAALMNSEKILANSA